jgi:glycosyltransferase involved in cell wall biosynthesis
VVAVRDKRIFSVANSADRRWRRHGSHGAALPTRGPRRVLYSITSPVTAIFLRGQLDHLKAAGFEVHVACAASPHLERLAVDEGFVLHDLPLTRHWMARDDLKGIWRAVRLLREVQPDVLNYSTPKASLVWAVASRFWRPRLVVYLLRGLRLESERPRSVRFLALWLTELIASRSADVVVCVSEELRRKARDLRLVGPEDAVVLGKGSSNGVSTSRFSPSPELRSSMRRHLGFADSDVVVGYVGRFVRDKGLYDLLDALTLTAKDVRCILVGDSELDVDIVTLLAERQLVDRVTVVDFTHDVRDYYAAMDILALPSHREGMPNVLLEAQAMALPCVTSEATGCRDAVAADESALVVPVAAPQELARAIDRLARDPALRARFGECGRVRMLEHFQQVDHWERYAQLYSGEGREFSRPKGEPLAGEVA